MITKLLLILSGFLQAPSLLNLFSRDHVMVRLYESGCVHISPYYESFGILTDEWALSDSYKYITVDIGHSLDITIEQLLEICNMCENDMVNLSKNVSFTDEDREIFINFISNKIHDALSKLQGLLNITNSLPDSVNKDGARLYFENELRRLDDGSLLKDRIECFDDFLLTTKRYIVNNIKNGTTDDLFIIPKFDYKCNLKLVVE